MKLSPSLRKQILVGHEGGILSYTTSNGPEFASDVARCYADGAINALIRLEGAEAATRFAFALSDRAAGGLRGETNVFPMPTASEAGPVAILAAYVDEGDGEEEDDAETDAAPPLSVPSRPDVPIWFLYWMMYLWPNSENKPDFGGDSRAVGWVITEEGLDAFRRISTSSEAA